MVKNLTTVQETWVQLLGWGDPLKKGMATHLSIIAWKIPWATVPEVAESWTRLRDSHFFLLLLTRLFVCFYEKSKSHPIQSF